LFADAEGRGHGVTNGVVVHAGSETGGAEIRLEPGGDIVGQIDTPAGVAVNGRWIALRPVPAPGGTADAIGLGPLNTPVDAGGRFRFRNVAPGAYRFATWLGAQYHLFPETIRVAAGVEGPVILTVRDSEASVAGQVVDALGRPVAHALVKLDAGGSDAPTDFTYTDPSGRFRLIGLEERRYRLVVESQGRHFKRALPEVRPGGPELTIALAPKTPITGRVLVAASGQPATQFWIRVFARRDVTRLAPGMSRRRFFRHAGGRFTLPILHDPFRPPPLLDGVYDLEAGSGDLVSRTVDGIRFEAGAVRVARTLRLEPGGTLEGRVVDLHGRPVDECRVVVFPSGGGSARRYPVRSAADGGFTLAPVFPGTYHLRASHPRAGVATTLAVLRAGSSTGVTIRLHPAARLTVQVRIPGGDPLPGAAVTLRPALGWIGMPAHLKHTDRRGVVELDGLHPGEVQLTVTHPDRRSVRRSLVVGRGRDPRIEVELPPRTGASGPGSDRDGVR